MHKKLLAALAAVGILTLAGCGDNPQPSYPDLDPALSGEYVADFSLGESEEVFASDGWSNKAPFNAVWKKGNLAYSDGQMHISIKADPTEFEGVTYPYSAGEARTHHLYGYGDYMVKMKPTNVVGSVSTFFTFTYDGDSIDGVKNKHDEIDIEFLGKDTTKVQFNYFVGGVGGHEYMYNLGFDASKEFHEYGFRWEENKISWVVDGKTAYVVNGTSETLPKCPGRIMTSYWPSSADGWSGHFAGPTADTVDYQWIKSSATGIYADGEEPVPPFDEEIEWADIKPFDNEYWNGNDQHYTITKIEKGVEVTYSESGNWDCVGTYIGDAASGAEAVNVTLFNDSNTESKVKVDVQGTTQVGNHKDINVVAYAAGHSEVTTNLEYGGSEIHLASKEEAQLKIEFDQTTERGALTNLAFFIDSLQKETLAHEGGKIRIKDIKFAKLDGTPVEPAEPVPPGPEPTEYVKLAFTTENSYTLDPEEEATESVNVTYSDMGASTWQNFSAGLSGVEDKTKFALNIKNNGEATAQVRVDVQGTTVVGNTNAINTNAYALAEGHGEVRTDTVWGGSFIEVAAAEEVTFVVEFDQSTERGAATNLMFFLDSARGTEGSYSGDITLSKFAFGSDEEEDFDWDKVEAEDITFACDEWTPYYGNIVKDETTGASTVTYEWASGWANVNTEIDTAAHGKNAMQLKLKNELEQQSVVRIDIKSAADNILNVSSEAAGHEDNTHPEWTYGSRFTLAAKEELTLVIYYSEEAADAHLLQIYLDSEKEESDKGGKVTISDVKFALIEEEVAEYASLAFSSTEEYTVDPNGVAAESVNVSYTEVAAASYKNITATYAEFEGKTSFKVTIKNNGEQEVRVRVDVLNASWTFINTSSSCEGGSDSYTDTEWGGSYVTVAAGESATLTVNFDQTTDKGAAERVMFYFDSTLTDGANHAGNVTISNFLFA